MIGLIIDKLSNPQFIASILVGIAAVAAILTIAMPLLETDTLGRRMKSVGAERERIRARERERLAKANSKGSLRYEPKAFMKQIVEGLNLSSLLGTDQAKKMLAMAGYRGPQAEIAFLFFRMVMPILLFCVTFVYIFFIIPLPYHVTTKIGAAVFAAYIGIKSPEIFLKNAIKKRQFSMRRAFPDSLDLLLICVESGMSIEHAFRRVSQEIGSQSVPLAEELILTMAELSYLPDRRAAYENFGIRTGLDSVRQIVTVLIQAERYGTPLGTALRVVSQESRDTRLMEAEKKAAGLPPKLTVPMILFFLPVLFAVIMTPAIIQISNVSH
ncbi:MAG TPA: type II secretion system F family protein [Beijerinckiaceae bacterium]|nr:type II secretion system F family protein [Beijerinckiaceae bacterium]